MLSAIHRMMLMMLILLFFRTSFPVLYSFFHTPLLSAVDAVGVVDRRCDCDCENERGRSDEDDVSDMMMTRRMKVRDCVEWERNDECDERRNEDDKRRMRREQRSMSADRVMPIVCPLLSLFLLSLCLHILWPTCFLLSAVSCAADYYCRCCCAESDRGVTSHVRATRRQTVRWNEEKR